MAERKMSDFRHLLPLILPAVVLFVIYALIKKQSTNSFTGCSISLDSQRCEGRDQHQYTSNILNFKLNFMAKQHKGINITNLNNQTFQA
jgi:hypothetical protein